MLQAGHGPRELQRLLMIGCLSVFGINTTVGVEHARPILLMCRNYCRLLEGSSMLDPYNEHHPENGYAPVTRSSPLLTSPAHTVLGTNSRNSKTRSYRPVWSRCFSKNWVIPSSICLRTGPLTPCVFC